MSEASDVQQRYRQFLDLLPLTIALAGLPPSDHGRAFTDDQLESRGMTLRKAYRQARNIAQACTES